MTNLRPLAVVLALGLMSAVTVPAFAQTTPPPADTAPPAGEMTAPPATEMDNDADDDGFDMGWLGLLGLAGLAGLRGRRHDDVVTTTRPTNVR
jgi:MYXO-CTERM domain-containing protein